MSIDKKFIINQQGRDFVLYAGLIHEAHQQGLKSIRTSVLQFPAESNDLTAIVHATVETERGVFTSIGDASPTNVSKMLVPHYIRMAETRAKARALRDALDISVTAFEELGDADAATVALPEQHSTTERQAAPTVPTDRTAAIIAAGEKVTPANEDLPLSLGHEWWKLWAQRVEKAKALGHPSIPSLPSTTSAKHLKDEGNKLVTWILAKEAEIDRATGKPSATAQALNLG